MTTEIIIKKVSSIVKAPSGAVTFGDVRSQMASDLLATLTEVINKKSDYPGTYYILIYSHIDVAHRGGNAIKERIMILPEKPKQKYLGTILFKIDNKNADAELEWILPLDIPMPDFIRPDQSKTGRILTDVRGIPLINRRLN
jgi:hypothetical protein